MIDHDPVPGTVAPSRDHHSSCCCRISRCSCRSCIIISLVRSWIKCPDFTEIAGLISHTRTRMRKISISTDHIPTGRRLKELPPLFSFACSSCSRLACSAFSFSSFERISILLDLRPDTCDLCLFTADHLLSLRLLLYKLTLQRIQIFIFFLKLCLFVLYSFHRILKLNQHIPVIEDSFATYSALFSRSVIELLVIIISKTVYYRLHKDNGSAFFMLSY